MYPTHYFQSIESTNAKAMDMAGEGAVSGTSIIAGNQTRGRGRLDKEWHSVAGKGLYCSIIVRPEIEPVDYPKITLVAGVAVAKVLDNLTGRCTQLKWPNDIYFSGRKCAGILTESSALNNAAASRYAVIGIGININHRANDFPRELRAFVTSLFLETGSDFVVDEIFQPMRLELLNQLQIFSRAGFLPILTQWRQKDYLFGKKMACVGVEGKIIQGVALGPDDDGQLHVRDADGRIHAVLSGDVRLATA